MRRVETSLQLIVSVLALMAAAVVARFVISDQLMVSVLVFIPVTSAQLMVSVFVLIAVTFAQFIVSVFALIEPSEVTMPVISLQLIIYVEYSPIIANELNELFGHYGYSFSSTSIIEGRLLLIIKFGFLFYYLLLIEIDFFINNMVWRC